MFWGIGCKLTCNRNTAKKIYLIRECWLVCFFNYIFRYLTLLLRIVLVLNMGRMSGMRRWTSISSGFFNIESVHISADGATVCVF